MNAAVNRKNILSSVLHRRNLVNIPQFIRFNKVQIYETVLKNLNSFVSWLLPLKPALKDAENIHFCCTIKEDDPFKFFDHHHLLWNLRELLLPICDNGRHYIFDIALESDTNAASSILSSIIQIPQVMWCSNVSIYFDNAASFQLPVNDISNWLYAKFVGMRINDQKERVLNIILWRDVKLDPREICFHLKEVLFFITS